MAVERAVRFVAFAGGRGLGNTFPTENAVEPYATPWGGRTVRTTQPIANLGQQWVVGDFRQV